jgi:hypothetical protein
MCGQGVVYHLRTTPDVTTEKPSQIKRISLPGNDALLQEKVIDPRAAEELKTLFLFFWAISLDTLASLPSSCKPKKGSQHRNIGPPSGTCRVLAQAHISKLTVMHEPLASSRALVAVQSQPSSNPPPDVRIKLFCHTNRGAEVAEIREPQHSDIYGEAVNFKTRTTTTNELTNDGMIVSAPYRYQSF